MQAVQTYMQSIKLLSLSLFQMRIRISKVVTDAVLSFRKDEKERESKRRNMLSQVAKCYLEVATGDRKPVLRVSYYSGSPNY